MARHEKFCENFTTCSTVRDIVLNTSQTCIRLCESLKLPIEIVTTSLYYLQRFFESCQLETIEYPLLCGSCILLSWKYWEDYGIYHSCQKLNEVCCEIFHLLVIDFSIWDYHEPRTKYSLVPWSFQKKKNCENSFSENVLKTTEDKKQSSTHNQLKEQEGLFTKETSCATNMNRNCGKPNNDMKDMSRESFTTVDWMLRDEGAEYQRVKEKIKIYEACLLRCLHYEIGPLQLPFETIHVASRLLWCEERRYREEQQSYNTKEEPLDKHLLQGLVELSSRFSLDFYRSPYCLLYSPEHIGLASVWKAIIILGFHCPCRYTTLSIMSEEPLSAYDQEKIHQEQLLQEKIFSTVQPVLRTILCHFRLLFDFLLNSSFPSSADHSI